MSSSRMTFGLSEEILLESFLQPMLVLPNLQKNLTHIAIKLIQFLIMFLLCNVFYFHWNSSTEKNVELRSKWIKPVTIFAHWVTTGNSTLRDCWKQGKVPSSARYLHNQKFVPKLPSCSVQLKIMNDGMCYIKPGQGVSSTIHPYNSLLTT